MVRTCSLLFLLAAAPAIAAGPHPLVRSVHVLLSGQWRADPHNEQSPEQCAKFHLSDKQALAWFKKSASVDKQTWLEQLDWTQCSANGTLIDKDGKIRNWTVDQSGRGQIQVSDKSSIYLSGQEFPFSDR